MKKRSIWNKYGKKTAEYVNEWGKWYRFDTYADFGINIVVYIVMLCLPFALLIVGNSNIIQAIIYAIFMLPICWGVSYCNYMNMYTSCLLYTSRWVKSGSFKGCRRKNSLSWGWS